MYHVVKSNILFCVSLFLSVSCEKFYSDMTIELQRELLPGSREKRTRLVICVIAGGSFFRPTALQQGNQAFGVSDLAALCLQVLPWHTGAYFRCDSCNW